MPKIAWFADEGSSRDEDWRLERWDSKPDEQKAEEISWAWAQWVIASCAERLGGHRWWLDWDADEGLWLHCQHCPAGADELYPDGQDMICGELPLLFGRKLVIDCGSAALDTPVQRWSGPVKVEVWEDKYHSWEGGWEYAAGITVGPA